MKYTLLFALLTFASCTKRDCYVCEIKTYTTPYGITGPVTVYKTECGMSYWDMKKYEAKGTWNTVHDSITVEQVTTCKPLSAH